jgi:hypothetical protein
MKFSMAGQYKGDCLIEVPAWTGLTVFVSTENVNFYNKETIQLYKKQLTDVDMVYYVI